MSPADLLKAIATTRLAIGTRVRIYLEPRDAWVGAYVARDAVYICLLPFIVFRWRRGDWP